MSLKLRLRFAKLGKVRFTSHRDTARMWERALRRLELPVAYTEGFNDYLYNGYGRQVYVRYTQNF